MNYYILLAGLIVVAVVVTIIVVVVKQTKSKKNSGPTPPGPGPTPPGPGPKPPGPTPPGPGSNDKPPTLTTGLLRGSLGPYQPNLDPTHCPTDALIVTNSNFNERAGPVYPDPVTGECIYEALGNHGEWSCSDYCQAKDLSSDPKNKNKSYVRFKGAQYVYDAGSGKLLDPEKFPVDKNYMTQDGKNYTPVSCGCYKPFVYYGPTTKTGIRIGSNVFTPNLNPGECDPTVAFKDANSKSISNEVFPGPVYLDKDGTTCIYEVAGMFGSGINCQDVCVDFGKKHGKKTNTWGAKYVYNLEDGTINDKKSVLDDFIPSGIADLGEAVCGCYQEY